MADFPGVIAVCPSCLFQIIRLFGVITYDKSRYDKALFIQTFEKIVISDTFFSLFFIIIIIVITSHDKPLQLSTKLF